tara:strand:- start:3435 stop:3644 length:210 start_codon:yes stop_codon:yes gene_type:complete
MQVVTVRFVGSMVQPSHHDCQIVEGSMSMRHNERCDDTNPPVCKIISPFGKDNTLEAFYMHEQWNCILD